MAQEIFDNPEKQAFAMMRPRRNIDFDTINGMILNASGDKMPINKQDIDVIRDSMIQSFAKNNNLSLEDATLLVDGSLSNPYRKGKNQIGRGWSYGMFESDPIKPNDLSGIENAKQWLKDNSQAEGVFHGYVTNDGEHFKLKKPIYFGKNANLVKYDDALGSSGQSGAKVKMQAFYRNQMEE